MKTRNLLVTGGAGYIGSHMCVELLNNGNAVTVVDNLSNASAKSLDAVRRITNRPLRFHEADIRDRSSLRRIFDNQRFDAVLHFAGLKAVGESVQQPLRYYDNNVNGTLSLLDTMREAGVKTMVFSSSATVYGVPSAVPISEAAETNPTNPYGRSKLMVETVLRDLYASDPEWRLSLLRYFNPVGAHSSGEIGEDPSGVPNNLMPVLSHVAVGRLPRLNVFGNDYPTPDGTGVRDYIHVVDLVIGHLRALEYLEANGGCHVHNLGTGRGYSVLEMVQAFSQASGREIPYDVVDRREGDVASSYAQASLATRDLGWRATRTLEDMCEDSWRWQSAHPDGFRP